MTIFKSQATQKNISFIVNIDSSISECLIMDKLRVIQILTNLVNNAIKFTPEHGTVDMSAKLLSRDKQKERILFSVVDTGIGIPKNRLETIFQSFIQADSSTTRKFGGTGLGLTIGASLCNLMGSRLQVESEEGKGSRFFFEVEFEICNSTPTLASHAKYTPIYVLDHNGEIYNNVITQLKHFGLEILTGSFEDLLCGDNKDNIIVTFNYKQYKPLETISSKIILIDDRKEAFVLAREEDILYHIGFFDEAPSILYNAILNYTISPQEEKILNSVDSQDNLFKVLVVEDYEMNRILIEEMLNSFGIQPDFAFDGTEAIKKVGEQSYNIIFMDINMPVKNGKEATKEILEIENQKGLKHIPIVALSANVIEADITKTMQIGFDDYLFKPIDEMMLDKVLIKYNKT